MDRRTVWAILLMMVIAITPAIFIKRPPRPAPGAGTAPTTTAPAPAAPRGLSHPPAPRAGATASAPRADTDRAPTLPRPPRPRARDTVRVTSPLYTYGISTAGGRLVEAPAAPLPLDGPAGQRRQRADPAAGQPAARADRWCSGRDTIPLDDWAFTASTEALDVSRPATPLRLTATRGAVGVELTYTLRARRLPHRRQRAG